MIPPPTPCSARAATNTAIEPDSPAARSPAAKVATPASTAGCEPRRSSRSPPSTIPTTDATRKALNGQPYQARPCSSRTAVGIAVATAIDSNATKVTSMSRPAVVSRCSRSTTDGGLLVVTCLVNSLLGPVLPGRRVERRPPRGSPLDAAVPRLLAGGDLLGRGRDDGVQVTDDPEVGELEDRGLGVLVDGHDGLRGLHAGPVLDRTGDADGDVQLRRDGLAGLADLEAVRVEAGVDGCPGRAHRRAEGVGERLDDREVLRAGHTA